jgi:hypothetical protein
VRRMIPHEVDQQHLRQKQTEIRITDLDKNTVKGVQTVNIEWSNIFELKWQSEHLWTNDKCKPRFLDKSILFSDAHDLCYRFNLREDYFNSFFCSFV